MTDNGTYTSIQDWMLDLGLDIYGVLAYAVIFGFSQDGESAFTGSLSYLARRMMCGRTKAISTLKDLVEKGLVEKNVVNKNGVRFCEYRAFIPRTTSTRRAPGGSTPREPNNIDNKTKVIKECVKEKASSPRFVKPSVEEVRAYCQERGNAVDPEEFVDFYESKGWVIGKSPMKSWQAAVRTWEKSKNTPRAAASAYRPKPKTDPLSSAFNTIDEIHRMFHPEESTIADEQ